MIEQFELFVNNEDILLMIINNITDSRTFVEMANIYYKKFKKAIPMMYYPDVYLNLKTDLQINLHDKYWTYVDGCEGCLSYNNISAIEYSSEIRGILFSIDKEEHILTDIINKNPQIIRVSVKNKNTYIIPGLSDIFPNVQELEIDHHNYHWINVFPNIKKIYIDITSISNINTIIDNTNADIILYFEIYCGSQFADYRNIIEKFVSSGKDVKLIPYFTNEIYQLNQFSPKELPLLENIYQLYLQYDNQTYYDIIIEDFPNLKYINLSLNTIENDEIDENEEYDEYDEDNIKITIMNCPLLNHITISTTTPTTTTITTYVTLNNLPSLWIYEMINYHDEITTHYYNTTVPFIIKN